MKLLGLKLIRLKKKAKYVKEICHTKFNNLLNRGFTADKPNQRWYTNFTHLKLIDGSKRYNGSIFL